MSSSGVNGVSEVAVTYHRQVLPSGVDMFYRQSGEVSHPVLLLLHGFPSSSHQYRDLIPRLNSRYRCIAPDLPGFGQTKVPDGKGFVYTFERLAEEVKAFVEALQLRRFALYIFDYGAPVGLRLALAQPERVTAIVSQNGNAYEVGLGDAWAPIRKLWENDTPENRAALHGVCQHDGIVWQYSHGVGDLTRLSPDGSELDTAYLARPGQLQIQLDLFRDYRTNVALYPQFHAYFRKSQVPLLAVWGDGDPFFVPAGAAAFKQDLPKAEVNMIAGAGHFALETHVAEIARIIRAFLDRNVKQTA